MVERRPGPDIGLERDQGFVFGDPVGDLYRDPAGYDPGPELLAALRAALLLGLPLLLTGEPGCGKTSVAHWLAWKLKCKPFVFNVKSSSIGRDLLYEFDELARFGDANAGQSRPPVEYLTLNALGLAILFSAASDKMFENGKTRYSDMVPTADKSCFSSRHVVLIDELDKAPRDTPNDLLAEIDQMQFQIRELKTTIVGSRDFRPAVIITSNSEKSLPEPFLRRCVFHHINAPDDKRRREIIARRNHPFALRPGLYDQAMRYFDRTALLGRPPGTAELLAWLTVLEELVTNYEQVKGVGAGINLQEIVRPTLGLIAKTREDVELAERLLNNPGV